MSGIPRVNVHDTIPTEPAYLHTSKHTLSQRKDEASFSILTSELPLHAMQAEADNRNTGDTTPSAAEHSPQ
jgi:hypothetical protein